MAEGKLEVTSKKKLVLRYRAKSGNEVPGQPTMDQLAADLARLYADKKTIDQLNGIEVEFDLDGSLLKRIRRKGVPWQPVAAVAPTTSPSIRQLPLVFHNPYNFVPAPDRPLDGPLGDSGDGGPISHDRLHGDRWTGTISVQLITRTPLLLLDTGRVKLGADDHKTFPVRRNRDDRPLIAPTSIKGMLRAAYEAITNSRFGVFAGHDIPLAYRATAQSGLKLIPCRIERTKEGLAARLLPGNSDFLNDGAPEAGHPMFAAFLRMYKREHERAWGPLATHGNKVWAYLTRWRHRRFHFFNVAELRRYVPAMPSDHPRDDRKPWRSADPQNGPGMWVEGYVCITGRNIDGKHDERVFFSTWNAPVLPLEESHVKDWRNLIENYRAEHEKEIEQKITRPPALGNYCSFSRHIWQAADEKKLGDGALCYAQVNRQATGAWKLEGLYPVMISRRLFPHSPNDCLSASLRPAESLKELSPADRVFGWVRQQGAGTEAAYRGKVRIGPVRCAAGADAVRQFDPPLPLAILGQPKPQQARFYLGDEKGNAQSRGNPKAQAGYTTSAKRIRGRKVYPHHAGLPDDYWTISSGPDRVQTSDQNYFREFVRQPADESNPQSDKDNQNRSIEGWVNPGTVFTFDIEVTNLTSVELGALLWLLSREGNQFHRLGGGKPLGFGSVALTIARSDLRTGNQWAEALRTLADRGQAETPTSCIEQYKAAVETTYRSPFLEVPFIKAWLRGAAGFTKPIHYPRTTNDPNPKSESFEWFVLNEQEENRRTKFGYSLPDLVNDDGLPAFNEKRE